MKQPDRSGVAGHTDADLLCAVARGEREALGELYDRLVPQMRLLAQRLLGGQQEAEDLIHDVFLEAWHRAHHYDHERATVSTWFLLRVRSRALDRLRHTRKLDTLDFSGSRPEPSRPDAPTDDDIAKLREGQALHLELGCLPAGQRRVVELSYFAGYSHDEIALRLAIPVGTVKSRTSRAIARLRQRLRSHQEDA